MQEKLKDYERLVKISEKQEKLKGVRLNIQEKDAI